MKQMIAVVALVLIAASIPAHAGVVRHAAKDFAKVSVAVAKGVKVVAVGVFKAAI